MNTKSRPLLVAAAVAALLVVLAVVSIMFGSSSDPDPSGAAPATGPVEVADVTVEGAALPQKPPADPDPAVGLTAPALTGSGVAGEPVSVRPGSGPMLLVFGAHWCPHCQAEFPRLVAAYEDGAFPEDLTVVAVSTAVSEGQPNFPPSAWFAEIRWPYPVLVDSRDNAAAAAYGLGGFPLSVLLDGEGRVLARHGGEFTSEQLTAFLAQLR